MRYQYKTAAMQLLGPAAMAVLLFSLLALQSSYCQAQADMLTPEERDWLSRHPVIRIAPEKGYAPFIFTDSEGGCRGISVDYIRLLEQRLGVRFHMLPGSDLKDNIDKAQRGQAEILTSLMETPERSGFLLFTGPYIEVPAVIIVRRKITETLALKGMQGFVIAVGAGYGVESYLRKNYGFLQIVTAPDDRECLRRLSFGEVSAAVVDLASASYIIESDKLTNLRVAGDTGFTYALSLASRKDWPELHRILGKGLAAISKQDRAAIQQHWITAKQPTLWHSRDFQTAVMVILGAAFLIVIGIFLVNMSLKHKVDRSTKKLQEELAERMRADAALEERESILRSVVDNLPVEFWARDLEGRCIMENAALVQHWGSILGKSVEETDISPETRAIWLDNNRRALSGEVVRDEVEFELEGRRRTVENIIAPVFREGAVSGLVGLNLDVTERRRAERDLRESEKRLAQLAEQSRTIIWEIDASGVFTYISRVAEQVIGYRPEDVQGKKHYYDIRPDAGREQFKSATFEVIARKEPFLRFENAIQAKSGGLVWVLTNGIPLLNPDGSLRGYRGSDVDITERKRAESALEQTESILIEAQQLAHMGSWILINPDTHETLWSEELYRIVGLPPGSPQKPGGIFEYINPEDSPQVYRKWNDCLGDSYCDLEYRIIRPSGDMRYIHDYGIYKYRDGLLLGAAGLVHDITDLKNVQLALEAKNAELERFAYTVSHDLRSPLVTIRTFLGHLEKDIAQKADRHISQDMDFLNAASQKMAELLNELLALSRIGRVTASPQESALGDILQEALGLLSGPLEQRGVRVRVTGLEAPVYGDRSRLVQVFQNLLENAIKFMGEQTDPQVDIQACIESGCTKVSVRDNGKGIDPRHMHKLFGLFEKLDPASEGVGIGLAMVKRIIEFHGGRTWAESDGIGKGSCFWFTLPGKRSES